MKKLDASNKILFIIVLLASIPQLLTIGWKDKLPNTLYNLYIMADAILWPIAFLLNTAHKKVQIFYLLIMLINVVLIASTFYADGIVTNFHYGLVCINSIIQVVYIAIHTYQISVRQEYIKLTRNSIFWASTGLLIYAPCTFFIFLFYDRINRSIAPHSSLTYLWDIHSLFNSIMYFCFFIGFWVAKRNYHTDD